MADIFKPEDEASLPPRLREDLAQLYAVPVRVPPKMDAQIISHARAGYVRNMRWRAARRWVAAAACVAAVLAVGVRIHLSRVRPASQLAGDINGDGKVNMLDAYLLASRLANGKSERAWDVNGDGVVDQKDVDWIANAAVHVQLSAVAKERGELNAWGSGMQWSSPGRGETVLSNAPRPRDAGDIGWRGKSFCILPPTAIVKRAESGAIP